MLMFIDFKANKIEIEGCEDDEMDVQKTLSGVANNINNFDVVYIDKNEQLKQFLIFISNQMFEKSISTDTKPGEPTIKK